MRTSLQFTPSHSGPEFPIEGQFIQTASGKLTMCVVMSKEFLRRMLGLNDDLLIRHVEIVSMLEKAGTHEFITPEEHQEISNALDPDACRQ